LTDHQSGPTDTSLVGQSLLPLKGILCPALNNRFIQWRVFQRLRNAWLPQRKFILTKNVIRSRKRLSGTCWWYSSCFIGSCWENNFRSSKHYWWTSYHVNQRGTSTKKRMVFTDCRHVNKTAIFGGQWTCSCGGD